MDYWGMPNVRTRLKPLAYAVDIPNRRAIIPGDGNNVVTFTYSYDMAKFIAKLLSTEEWPELAFMGGDDLTLNELVKMGEEISGMMLTGDIMLMFTTELTFLFGLPQAPSLKFLMILWRR